MKNIYFSLITLCSFLIPLTRMPKLRKKRARINGLLYRRLFAKKDGRRILIFSPFYLHGAEFISIKDNFYVDCGMRLDAFGKKGDGIKLEIGANFCAQKDCHIGASNRIVIGDNVLLASRVYISDHSHGEINSAALALPPSKRPIVSKGPIVIGDNVWIGEGVAVLANVTLGDNCIVGANSVVTKSFPANSVIAGNPARLIRTL